MPGRHYNRRVRKNAGNSYVPLYIEPRALVTTTGECDLLKVHEYFYYIIDLITEQFNFTETIAALNVVVESLTTKLDYYNILNRIENDLLSVVDNISNGINGQLIKCRIDYIKNIIDELPPSCQDIGPVSDMTLQLLDYILTETDFNVIRTDINKVLNFLNTTFPNISLINDIQDKLIDIICDIASKTNPPIIQMRINYVQTLVTQIQLN
jgi:hypothetical protein